MLNAMFREFQRLLNDGDTTCGLFNEFNTQPWRAAEYREKFDNLGVLYINNGNLNKLPDGAMMEISYTLELFMKVDENFNNSTPVVLPLENFATGTTGTIYTDNDGSMAQYVLDTGLPTSDGALIECGDCNYIRYQVPIGVVFTNGVALSDNNNIVLTIDGTQYPALKSVISFVEAPQAQPETSVFVNTYMFPDYISYKAMQNESFIVATSWNAQINKLYRPDQAVDVALRKLILDNPRKVVTVKYKASDSDEERTRKVILHDCAFTNELGQATCLTINMSTAMRGV